MQFGNTNKSLIKRKQKQGKIFEPNPPVPWAGISRVFHGYFTGTGDTCPRPRPRVRSSRSSMGGYFTGTGTSIYSSKLVIRPCNLSRWTVPAKILPCEWSLAWKYFCVDGSRGRVPRTHKIPVKYPPMEMGCKMYNTNLQLKSSINAGCSGNVGPLLIKPSFDSYY